MNSATAQARHFSPSESAYGEKKSPLKVVEGTSSKRSPIVMSIIAILALVCAIVAPLIINTQMAQTSYSMRKQHIELRNLQIEEATLRTKLQDASSPVGLAQSAQQNGMVPAGQIGMIYLEQGKVEGGEAAK